MQKTLYQRAILAHQTNKIDEAETIYQELLATDPHNADVLHLLSILYAQKKAFTKALEYMERALIANPNSASYHNSMGNIYKNLQELPKAINEYQEAMRLKADYAVAHNNIANVYYKLAEHDAAIQHYREAIRINPNYTDAHFNLSLLLAQRNLLDEAIKHLNTVLNLDPKHAEAHAHLGHILQLQGKNQEAIAQFYLALKTNPVNIQAHHHLGAILCARQKYNAALKHFNKILLLEPSNIDALHNTGAIFLIRHNAAAALKYFLRLSQLSHNLETFYNLGVIYMDLGHFNDAILYFSKALEIDPTNTWSTTSIYTNLGAIYLKQENYIKATHAYEAILAIDPDNKEAKYILAAIKQNNNALKAAPDIYIKNLFNQYADKYEEHLTLLNYRVPELIYDTINTYFATAAPTDLNILDLGCGTGLCGVKLRGFAKKLIGIDLAEQMLAYAKDKNIYDILKKSSIDKALKTYNHLDIIVAADTFVYIGDLANIFAACYKALAPKGLLIFTIETTHNYPYILQKSARFAHAPKYIEELAQKCTFSIENSANIMLRKHKTTTIEGKLYMLAKQSVIPERNAEI
jgi:predicted TPR repeat methyltransferase